MIYTNKFIFIFIFISISILLLLILLSLLYMVKGKQTFKNSNQDKQNIKTFKNSNINKLNIYNLDDYKKIYVRDTMLPSMDYINDGFYF